MSSVLTEFARTLTADFPIQSILDTLVQRVVEVIDVTGAGVVLMGSDDRMNFAAASDRAVRRTNALQLDLGEGPSIASYATGECIHIPDLVTDTRFPRFSPRAAQAGLANLYTFPLRLNGLRLGALDVYRAESAMLEEAELAGAQVLADAAASYLYNAQARSEMRELAAQSHHAAMHDPLTGLPNRALLTDRIDHALRRSARASSQIGLLCLDLDNFAAINDYYGHDVGDQILVAIANRLSAALRPGDSLSRLAGDEFSVLCEDLTKATQIHEIARRVLGALEGPFMFERGTISLSASVGVTLTPETADRLSAADTRKAAEELLQQADTAMFEAKHAGGGRYSVLTAATRIETSQRQVLERDLGRAVHEQQLHLVYQPIAHALTGEWLSVEALLRWDHPSLGAVDAASIVEAAERTGLMTPVGRWVLSQACTDLAAWREIPGLLSDSFTVAVNVSPTELLDPNYPSTVRRLLATHQLPAASLCLELTESVLVKDSPTTLAVLDALKESGITLALDDFGTGYSTLTYLRQLPADVVKIDRSFLSRFDDVVGWRDQADRAIVSALITLSHALGLTVVAEGVETSRQLERLQALGCDLIQGHLSSAPVSGALLPEMLAERPGWAADTRSLPPIRSVGHSVGVTRR